MHARAFHKFSDKCLSDVLTMSDVCYMWDTYPKRVMLAFWKMQIQGRDSTGGVWLFSRTSLVRLWGEPKFQLLNAQEKDGD